MNNSVRRVRSCHDAASSIETCVNASFRNSHSLLLHDLVDGNTISFTHFIKLIDAHLHHPNKVQHAASHMPLGNRHWPYHSTICQDHCSGFETAIACNKRVFETQNLVQEGISATTKQKNTCLLIRGDCGR